MKDYQREYPMFAACGLNCGLCPRFYTQGPSRCPGCGGAGFFEKHPSCGVISCTRKQGVEHCFECETYPCPKMRDAHRKDSFITHRNLHADSEAARAGGLRAYRAGLDEKMEMLRVLLAGYDNGRRKSFFCLAVNLLPGEDVRQVLRRLSEAGAQALPEKERGALAVRLLQEKADGRDIPLRLESR